MKEARAAVEATRAVKRRTQSKEGTALKATRINPRQRARTAVYRLYDQSGVLLYVGISDKPTRRWTQHESGKPWYSEVHTSTVEWHPNREAALWHERRAIRIEGPRYNVEHALDSATSAIVGQWIKTLASITGGQLDERLKGGIDHAITEIERLVADSVENDEPLEDDVVSRLMDWVKTGNSVDEVPCYVLGSCVSKTRHIRCSMITNTSYGPCTSIGTYASAITRTGDIDRTLFQL